MDSFNFEPFDDATYGILAVAVDVWVGSCREYLGGLCLFELDDVFVGGPFPDIGVAMAASSRLFAHLAGEGNPGPC
jgi:hypothetical protein